MTQLGDVLASTKASLESVGTAADGVPKLVAEVEALAAETRALPMGELVASATRLVDNVDAFVESEGVANLPGSVEASLAELRGVVADLRAGGAVENANATLATVRQMTDELAAARLTDSINRVVNQASDAANNVNLATRDLPELIDQARAVTAKAEALPLEDLVATGTRVSNTADGLLAAPGVSEVPPNLAAALEELRAILAELREGGAVENVNATLASADRAADAITAAADDLPALVAQLSRKSPSAPTPRSPPSAQAPRSTATRCACCRRCATPPARSTRWSPRSSAAPTPCCSGGRHARPTPRRARARARRLRRPAHLLPAAPGPADGAPGLPGRLDRRRRPDPAGLRRRARDRLADRPRHPRARHPRALGRPAAARADPPPRGGARGPPRRPGRDRALAGLRRPRPPASR